MCFYIKSNKTCEATPKLTHAKCDAKMILYTKYVCTIIGGVVVAAIIVIIIYWLLLLLSSSSYAQT